MGTSAYFLIHFAVNNQFPRGRVPEPVVVKLNGLRRRDGPAVEDFYLNCRNGSKAWFTKQLWGQKIDESITPVILKTLMEDIVGGR